MEMRCVSSFLLKLIVAGCVLCFHRARAQTVVRCPTSWKPYTAFSGALTCVWLSNEKATWMEAMNWCKLMDGQLVEIGSDSFNTAITDMIIGKKPGKYWIGLSDMESEMTYKWMTSKRRVQNSYLFKSGQKTRDPVKNCGCTDEKGEWLVETCQAQFFFVCQRIMTK